MYTNHVYKRYYFCVFILNVLRYHTFYKYPAPKIYALLCFLHFKKPSLSAPIYYLFPMYNFQNGTDCTTNRHDNTQYK